MCFTDNCGSTWATHEEYRVGEMMRCPQDLHRQQTGPSEHKVPTALDLVLMGKQESHRLTEEHEGPQFPR